METASGPIVFEPVARLDNMLEFVLQFQILWVLNWPQDRVGKGLGGMQVRAYLAAASSLGVKLAQGKHKDKVESRMAEGLEEHNKD